MTDEEEYSDPVDLYPSADDHIRRYVDYPGSFMEVVHSFRCMQCGEETTRIDFDFNVRICSMKCWILAWDDYWAANKE